MVKKTAAPAKSTRKTPKKAEAPEVAPPPAPHLLGNGRALEHGHDAVGAQQLRAGFATTPEMDLAFALGWPHLFGLSDDHPEDADADNAARRRLTYEHVWPRGIATRWCRLTAINGFNGTPEGTVVLDEAGEAAVVRDDAITADEARAMIVE